MQDDTFPICDLAIAVFELAHTVGGKSPPETPGCWAYEFLNVPLSLAINGHQAFTPDSGGFPVPPSGIVIRRSGTVIAIIRLNGGVILEGQDEDALIADINKETEIVRASKKMEVGA